MTLRIKFQSSCLWNLNNCIPTQVFTVLGSNPFAYTDSVMVGKNPIIIWNAVGSRQTVCGTCHKLPPTGHTTATTCNGCHPRVVDQDFNIIDKNLHINGKIDVF